MTHHILIIDSQVDDYQQLVAGAKPGFDVFVLDAHHDGIEQITQILNASRLTPHTSLSLHIVSHGSPGTLYLGNSQLSLDTLERYAAQIATWFPSQASELLLYGCNVAAGDAGEEFLSKLYSLAKVKLAASTTPIGNKAFGGNWYFDVTTHNQLTEIAFNAETTASYSHTFATLPNISTLFNFNGSATQTSSNEARLTSAITNQNGSAFSSARIDFNSSWDFTFELYFGNSDAGADGIGFVLHNDPDGASAIGNTGEGLGIAGVQNSVGIEFDTYYNPGTSDLVADHTSFLDPETGASFTTPTSFASNIEDGSYHTVVVNWNAGTQTLSYSFDGNPTGSITRNVVANDFGGSSLIYWGFGAATGGSVNEHRVRMLDFNGRLIDASGNEIINNARPSITSASAVNVQENSTGIVLDVNATDADGDAITYSITGGADATQFSVNNSTGELSFVSSPNYEDPSDSNDDNIYEVQVTANDGNGGTTDQTINVTVTNVNEAPVIGGGNADEIAIIGAAPSTYLTDVELQLEGTGFFNVVDVFAADSTTPTLAQLQNYDSVIVFSDGGFQNSTQLGNNLADYVDAGGGVVLTTFAFNVSLAGRWSSGGYSPIQIASQNQGTPLTLGTIFDPSHPILDGVNSFSGGSSSYHNTGDANPNATVIANWSNGRPLIVDLQTFNAGIVGLNFYAPSNANSGRPDFWDASTDGDLLMGNALEYVADGGDPIDESATEDDAAFTVDLLAGAFDEDGDVLNVTNLTLTSGDDSGVTINGNSLDIDPNAYNSLAEGESEVITYSYDISDGNGGTVAQTATITINGVNDAPTVSTAVTSTAIEDDATFSVDLLAGASDVDTSDTLSVSGLTLDSGNDAGVTINGNSLDIDPSAYNYLAEGESEVITYSYTISDGNEGGTVAQTDTVTINGVNDAPTVSTAVTSTAIEDDATFSVDLLAGASDVDTSDTLSVSGLTLDSGNDSGVTINGNSLDIDPSVYNSLAAGESEVITYSYTISDGNGGTVAQTATITINGINDIPAVSAAITATKTEEDAVFSVDLLAGASDVDTSDTLSVSGLTLDSGDDAGVTINGNSLDIDPSVYNALGAGESEVITYSYTISDGNEGTVAQTATITINGVNDAPEITSSDTVSINENSTTVITVVATDVDGDSIAYSITGGADAALFGINGTTGELSFIAAPDAENPLDNDGDNVYQVEVTATDGNEGTAVQTLTVSVGNVNDNPPVFTSSATPTLAENSTAVTTVVATDADGDPITYSISGGVDAALFAIDETTGALRFITAPDFEMPTDNGSDNVYEVTVSASDGNEATTQTLSISVVDLSNGVTDFNNDNLPDVVWRRPSTGQTNIWFTDGKIKIGGGPAGATIENPNWLTVGVGDFDKDGKRDDILWRNVATGANVIWFMDGINKVGNATLDTIGTKWEVQGVGDFDHQDYTDDILWRNQSTGQTIVWTMDGTTKTGTTSLGTLGTAWKAQGVGDFEGNNFVDDIVWRNYTTGQTIVWETDGQQKTGSFALDTVSTNWKVDGVGDLDGDGTVDDLLWYNTSNNAVVTWFIDNGVKVANSTIGAPSDGWDAVL